MKEGEKEEKVKLQYLGTTKKKEPNKKEPQEGT